MKVPRDVHGRQFAKFLIRRWEFVQVRQTASHLILRTQTPSQYTVSVPEHKPVRPGTLHDLITAIAAHKKISPEALVKDL